MGEKPSMTAEREFHEDTGLTAAENPRLIDMNLIDIPYNVVKDEKHQHIDFRYLLA